MKKQKNDIFLICLTGLTGAGKTTTKEIFATHAGVQTFYTKELHKDILGDAVNSVNKMDVSKLFSEKNAFIKHIMDVVEEKRGDASIIVLDSIRSTDEFAYLKELGYASVQLIHVECNESERIKRIEKRDHITIFDIHKRDKRDMGADEEKMFNMLELFSISDSVLYTSGTIHDIRNQVDSIITKIKNEKENKMELEMKFKIDKDYVPILEQQGYEKGNKKHQIDIYFLNGELVDGKKTWLRLREDKLKGTFSCDLHRLNSEFSTEETEVPLATLEEMNNMKKIFRTLGHSIQCVVNKERQIYKKGEIEICLDRVEGLGTFLEVEMIAEETNENILKLKKVVHELGLSAAKHIRGGYPNLLIATQTGKEME